MKYRGTLPSYLLQGGNQNGRNCVLWLMAVDTMKEALQPVVAALCWGLKGTKDLEK